MLDSARLYRSQLLVPGHGITRLLVIPRAAITRCQLIGIETANCSASRVYWSPQTRHEAAAPIPEQERGPTTAAGPISDRSPGHRLPHRRESIGPPFLAEHE